MTDLRTVTATSVVSTTARQSNEVVVKVTGVDIATQKVMAVDTYSNEFEIDGSNRPKGTGFPQEGDTWTVVRRGSQWYLGIELGGAPIKVITGSRSGLHPILDQMLDALAAQGKVADATNYVPDPIVDSGPPTPPTDPAEDEDADPVLVEPNAPADEAGPGPEPTPTPTPTTHEVPSSAPASAPATSDYTGRWTGLYVGTYNVLVAMSNTKAEADLRRLAKTRLQIFSTQEMNHPERDGMVSRLTDLGWSHHRPGTGSYSAENTIFWRTAQFVLKASGVVQLSAPDGAKKPARWMSWVRLLHKASNREIFFLGTHTNAHVEDYTGHVTLGPGHPSNDPARKPFLPGYYTQVAALRAQLRSFGNKGPTILVGDMNLDYFADARIRYSKFPYAQWTAVKAVANWGAIHHRPAYGTHGNRYIDQVWSVRAAEWQMRFVDHWILTGYHSDHKPVMVKMQVRSKR